MVVAEAGIVSLFRTLVIIIGAFVIVRFLGQLMNAKRNMEDERQMNQRQRKFDKEKKSKKANLGKTQILGKNKGNASDVEDVNFEEIKD